MKPTPDQQAEALKIILGLDLFTGCPEAFLKALSARVDRRELAKDKVLLLDQEIGQTLFLLASGSLGIWKRVGGQRQILATLPAPTFVGERTMFEESPANAMVKAEEACVIYALSRKDFEAATLEHPSAQEVVLKNMQIVRARRFGSEAGPKPEIL